MQHEMQHKKIKKSNEMNKTAIDVKITLTTNSGFLLLYS